MELSRKTGSLVACAVAAAIGSATALAVEPPNLGGPASPDFVFYIGGGSAEPQAVAVATCNLMSNVDLYTSAAGGAGDSAYYVLYGTTKAATPKGLVPANSNVMVLYKFNGGSLPNGGIPQSSSSTGLPYPAVSAILAGTDAVVSGQTAGTFCTPGNGVPTIQAPAFGSGTSLQPSFGLTDLEPSAFVGINNPLSPAALPVVGAHTGVYDLVFGLAVTSELFAQKTNFSYADVAAILSGAVTNWNQLHGDNGAPLPAGDVILLDRNIGSGHKTSSSAEFLGYPQLGSAETLPTSVVNGYFGGSDGNGTPPAACAAGYQDVQETSAAGTVKDLKALAASGCGLRAVGILSMDNPPGIAANQNVSGTNAYDFVALNGTWVDAHNGTDDENSASYTSYDNVVLGNYTWFYQASFNTQSGFLSQSTQAADLANVYKTQLTSASLPGCAHASGAKFPGNLPGTIVDGDETSALSTCVGIASRKGNSDRPLISTLDSGSVSFGQDPL